MNTEIIVTSLIVIVGWVVAHLLTQYRDKLSKRQIKRTEYLITAYRKLENSANRHEQDKS